MYRKFLLVLLTAIILLSSGRWIFQNHFAATPDANLHVALVGPMSGASASTGEVMARSVQLLFDRVNAQGGVNNHRLVLDIYDDANDPDKARRAVEEMARTNRAVASIGHDFSSVSDSAGPLYEKYGIPVITPTSTGDAVTEGNEWYFRTIIRDSFQARFLAGYVKRILKKDKVIVVASTKPYGKSLADPFVREALGIGLEVVQRFDIDPADDDPMKADKIFAIRKLTQDGLVLLAVQQPEGYKIVKALRDARVETTLLGPDSLASTAFVRRFHDLPEARRRPGFYTYGMYVATPFIPDTANHEAQEFLTAYLERHGELPPWAGPYAYDAAKVIIAALRETGAAGAREDIASRRQAVRDHVASLNSPDRAVPGATGLNFFDSDGNATKSISVGIHQGEVVSALIQLQIATDVQQNVDHGRYTGPRIQVGRVLLDQTAVAYTGFDIREVSALDFDKRTADINFDVWFRYQGDVDVSDIVFENAVGELDLGEPIRADQLDGINYRLYRAAGTFRMDAILRKAPVGRHMIGPSFTHRTLSRAQLVFAADTGSIPAANGTELGALLNTSQVLNEKLGWHITRAHFYQNVAEYPPLGDPRHIGQDGRPLEHSRFTAAIQIDQNQLTPRRRFFFDNLELVVIGGTAVVLLLLIAATTERFARFGHAVYFVLMPIAATLLLLGESLYVVYISDSFSVSDDALQAGIIGFDILWWLTPMVFVIVGVYRFIWGPLESATERTIPAVAKNFVTVNIVLLTVFGIVAFVFARPVTSLLATSGVVAMIIGLAVQMNVSNIFSGLAINIERPFRVGDYVTIGSLGRGRIEDITWRSTKLSRWDGALISVPNSMAAESVVENYSFPNRRNTLTVEVHVSPKHDPEHVVKILKDALVVTLGKPGFVDDSGWVKFTGVTEWAAGYTVAFDTDDPSVLTAFRHEIFVSVWDNLNRAGIAPAVQQDIRLHRGKGDRGTAATSPLALLEELYVFQPFDKPMKEALSQRMVRVSVHPDEIIVEQGEAGSTLFVIIEGVVSIRVKTTEEEQMEVARLGPGSFFGEMSLLTGEPRSASVVALTETALYEISKQDMERFLQANPEVAKDLSHVLARRKLENEARLTNRKVTLEENRSLGTKILSAMRSFFNLG